MNLHVAESPIPIIAMTGPHGYTELYLKTAKALGATRVRAKPFGFTEFLEATREAMSPGGFPSRTSCMPPSCFLLYGFDGHQPPTHFHVDRE